MQSIKREMRDHETWLANYEGGSRNQYTSAWNCWIEYIKPKDEHWILENLHSEDWGAHLVNFRRSLSQKKKQRGKGTLSDNRTRLLANAIRSYLVHVGATLTLSKTQKFALMKIESMPETDYPFNIKVKELLMRVADPVEDYVVCLGVSLGFRVGDFIKITRGTLEPLLNSTPPIQLPEIMTQKEGVRAFPFIDRDAKQAIERLLKMMDAQGRSDPEERMLEFQTRMPSVEVNDILKRVFEKAEVPLGAFRVRFHILRKFLTDKLSSVCAEDKWKHFVGKKTRSPYVSKEGHEAYGKVMEFTCVNHKNLAVPSDIKELRLQVESQEREIADLMHKLMKLTEAFEEAGFKGSVLMREDTPERWKKEQPSKT